MAAKWQEAPAPGVRVLLFAVAAAALLLVVSARKVRTRYARCLISWRGELVG
jgi:hypothetical protein